MWNTLLKEDHYPSVITTCINIIIVILWIEVQSVVHYKNRGIKRWRERCKRQRGKNIGAGIWLMNQSYPNIIPVHHTYLTLRPTTDTYLKSRWCGDDGTGILSHIKTCLQTRDRWRERACLSLVVLSFILTLLLIIIIRRWNAKLTLDH